MKLTVERNELWRGIETVLDVVPAKPAMPILSNLLIHAEGDRLSLAATDLDLSIKTSVAATVEEGGSVTVPARTLAEIAREWPESDLRIVVESERIHLSGRLGTDAGGEGAYTLSGIPAEEFPEMPTSLEGLSIDWTKLPAVDGDSLSKMIERTVFAVSKDDTRPVLNGVFWRLGEDGMDMVATDGSRMACYRRNLDLKDQIKGHETSEVIVPPQSLNQLVKLIGKQHQVEHVTVDRSQVLFDMGETRLLTRLIEGPYVDYGQVIPQDNHKDLRISNAQLLPAVRRVSILSSSYTRQVRMRLGSSSVELSASSQELGGDAREQLPATYDDEEMEIGFNATYLLEILRKIDSSDVHFSLNNPVTAALLRPVDQGPDEDYFCLLMPLRPSG
jgi:DNA polymerase-3 subunit beta